MASSPIKKYSGLYSTRVKIEKQAYILAEFAIFRIINFLILTSSITFTA